MSTSDLIQRARDLAYYDEKHGRPGTASMLHQLVGEIERLSAAKGEDGKIGRLDASLPGWRETSHPNGCPKFSEDGTMLDANGNRSIFDDVDE